MVKRQRKMYNAFTRFVPYSVFALTMKVENKNVSARPYSFSTFHLSMGNALNGMYTDSVTHWWRDRMHIFYPPSIQGIHWYSPPLYRIWTRPTDCFYVNYYRVDSHWFNQPTANFCSVTPYAYQTSKLAGHVRIGSKIPPTDCTARGLTNKLCYRKDDRATRLIYECPESFWDSQIVLMHFCSDPLYECA